MSGVLVGQWRSGLAATAVCGLSLTLFAASANAQSQGSPYQAAPYQNGAPPSAGLQQRAATGYPASAVPRTQVPPSAQRNATQGYPAQAVNPNNGNPAYGAAPRGRVDVAEARPAAAGQPLTNNVAQQAAIDPRHPLAPVVGDIEQAYQVLSTVKNYECIFSKRELVDGKLNETENMYFKVRHEPFSIYLYCYGPAKPKGQEAIYVEGRNNGQVVAHSTGIRAIAGTLNLDPLGTRMMEGNRHPITNAGMKNLSVKLLDRYRREAQYGGSVVKEYPGVQVAGRTCKCLEVTHPQPFKPFEFNVMRIYLDSEWKIPIRMEAYGWPAQQGGELPLLEEYTYSKLKFNMPLTEQDFDPNNPNYGY
jgi:hypothetical protein